MNNQSVTGSYIAPITTQTEIINDKINKFIEYYNTILNEDNIHPGNTCIILYKCQYCNDFFSSTIRQVYAIFKTIDDFKLRVEEYCKKIDEQYGIDFQLWIFD